MDYDYENIHIVSEITTIYRLIDSKNKILLLIE